MHVVEIKSIPERSKIVTDRKLFEESNNDQVGNENKK